MKLLIIELSHSAGTHTVVRNILPQFINLYDSVFYCGHNAAQWRSKLPLQSITFGELIVSHGTFYRRLRALLAHDNGRSLLWSCMESYIRFHQITHVFFPWVIGQSIPRLSARTGAMVMDLLWHHFPLEFPVDCDMDNQLLVNLSNMDVVFPVSESTTAELTSVFNLPNLNIVTVPHGSNVPSSDIDIKSPDSLIPQSFFFYPSQTTSNKNHLCIFEAIKLLYDSGLPVSVVFTSKSIARLRDGVPEGYQEEILTSWLATHSYLLNNAIHLIGEVLPSEIRYLYARCTAVLLPSTYEGFGLPLLEAFEAGAKVICSDIPPFLEQIDRYAMSDRAITLNPLNPKTLADAMISLTSSDIDRYIDSHVLAQRLHQWTWKDACQLYFDSLSSFRAS